MPLFGPPDIGKLTKQRNVAGLLEALSYRKSWEVRRNAAWGLGEIGEPFATQPLVAALRDEDQNVRRAAAEALTGLDWEADGEEAEALYWIAMQQWQELGQLGKPAVEPLIASLFHSEFDPALESSFIAKSIAGVCWRDVGALLAALDSREAHVQEHAAWMLGAAGDAQVVEPLVAALRRPGAASAPLRVSAAYALGHLGSSRGIEPLATALRDGDPLLRRAAGLGLGWIGDARGVGALIAALGDSDPVVQRIAVEALGGIRSGQAVDALLALVWPADLASQEDWATSASAIRALGKIRDRRSVDGLARVLAKALALFRTQSAYYSVDGLGLVQKASRLTESISEALSRIGGEPAGQVLLEFLERVFSLLEMGFFAFADMGTLSFPALAAAEALGRLDQPLIVHWLGRKLEAGVPTAARVLAVKALGRIGGEEAAGMVLTLVRDSDVQVRGAAAEALGKAGDRRAAAPLIGLLGDAEGGVSEVAAEALGQLGDARAVEPLVARLEDSNQPGRGGAVRGLGMLRDAQAVGPLLTALGKRESSTDAAEGLGHIGDPRAVEALIAALSDDDQYLRQKAAEALGRIKDARAARPLIEALDDRASQVRQAARKSLGQVAGADAVDAMVAVIKRQCVQCEDMETRSSVVGALAKIDDPRATEALVEALRDPTPGVRKAAAEALGRIGGPRALEAVLTAARDAFAVVRMSAAKALGEVGDAAARERLVDLLEDGNEGVRWSAAGALRLLGWEAEVPEEATRLCERARALREEKPFAEWDDAEAAARQAIALAPYFGKAHFLLADMLLLRWLHKDERCRFPRIKREALDELQKAARLMPEDPAPLYRFCQSEEPLEEIIPLYDKAIGLPGGMSSEYGSAHWAMALAAAEAANRDYALDSFRAEMRGLAVVAFKRALTVSPGECGLWQPTQEPAITCWRQAKQELG